MPCPEKAPGPEEVYYIRQPAGSCHPDRLKGQWRKVGKADYAKFEGLSACAAKDEIIERVAKIECIPKECIYSDGWGDNDGKVLRVVVGPTEALPEILEWAKRTGEAAECHYYGLSAVKLARGSGMAISKPSSRRDYRQFVIGSEFVVDSDGLRYDPPLAGELTEKHKASLADDPPKVRPRSKIKVCGNHSLSAMFRIVDAKIDKTGITRYDYPGHRGWANSRLIRVSSPNDRQQHLWAIPLIVKFYATFTGKRNYRTKDWKQCVMAISRQLNDSAMTDEFRKFVKYEMRFCR